MSSTDEVQLEIDIARQQLEKDRKNQSYIIPNIEA
tara:strand:+ start:745 stop:849 length:105 start_codon:yes stop_codon:yes gene_type:complete